MATETPFTLRFKVLEMARNHLSEEYHSKRDTPFSNVLLLDLENLLGLLQDAVNATGGGMDDDVTIPFFELQNRLETLEKVLDLCKGFQYPEGLYPSVAQVTEKAQELYKFVEQK